jgi:DNA-binding NarL/FixJ family response regulator
MIPILIVDDHPVFREGLRALLETQLDLSVVGIVGQGADAAAAAQERGARVILLDMGLPDMPGTAVCRLILDSCPSCRVVMLSANDADESITGALAAGAAGYVLKTEEPTQIFAAIRAADRGETVLPGPVAQKVVRQLIQLRQPGAPLVPDHLAPLTDREREVFQLAAQGQRNSEIARELILSEETVKTHLRNIYNKLGLTNKAELRLFALQGNRKPEPDDEV